MSTPAEILEGGMEIQKSIEIALKKNKGLLVGRFGTVEFEGIWWTIMFPNTEWPERQRMVLERNAGIFPSDMNSVRVWVTEYCAAIRASDILAVGWHAPIVKAENELLFRLNWKGKKVVLRSLEPYYLEKENRWSSVLKDEHLCVVTSFAESAAAQLRKGEDVIWGNSAGSLWPNKISFVKTGYAPSLAQGRAGWEESPESWKEAIDSVVAEVLKTGARVVFIGCGGIGMIIGARLKEAGKICVVLGGATQVLFGIKGNRWEKHPVISGFWRDSWIWPSVEETPLGAGKVEEGCYWGDGRANFMESC
jgi:hypothetical protein